jgi:hypothetical protein
VFIFWWAPTILFSDAEIPCFAEQQNFRCTMLNTSFFLLPILIFLLMCHDYWSKGLVTPHWP